MTNEKNEIHVTPEKPEEKITRREAIKRLALGMASLTITPLISGCATIVGVGKFNPTYNSGGGYTSFYNSYNSLYYSYNSYNSYGPYYSYRSYNSYGSLYYSYSSLHYISYHSYNSYNSYYSYRSYSSFYYSYFSFRHSPKGKNEPGG